MTDILFQYLFFFAKTLTVVAVPIGIIMMVVLMSRKRGQAPEKLQVRSLNQRYERMALILKREVLSKREFKKVVKQEKSRKRDEKKAGKEGGKSPKRVFVMNFRGDIKATGVSCLREEITATLTLATPEDEIVVRLENAGGLVHEHGLAASQLQRIRERNIPLTIAVDEVAASGGYLMACMGNRIIAAPYAIIGSIGVLTQIPNFHRLLERNGIDFELLKAGEMKRTLTMFGKNTEEDRAQLRRQLEETHSLFKDSVDSNRPGLDMAKVSTGEYWYGTRALELHLVDSLMTSDDYLLSASQDAKLYEVSYTTRKSVSDRLVSLIQSSVRKVLNSLWQETVGERFLS